MLLHLRMLLLLSHSLTNVLCGDGWIMLDEIAGLDDQRHGWAYLWAPHWGQRMVLSRLAFLLDARLFSFSSKPLVIVNLAAVLCGTVLLARVAWNLIGPRSRRWGWCAVIVTVNLLLSGLQMETFIREVTNHFTVGYLACVAAIVVLGRAAEGRRLAGPLAGSAGLAVVATLSLPVGLLLWPVLCLQSWMINCARRSIPVFAVLGAVATALYSAGYYRPDMGMGPLGILQNPMGALRMAGMILGGPISVYSVALGTVAGWVGILVAGCVFLGVLRQRRGQPVELVICAMVALFFLGVVLSLVAARISPEWLAAQQSYPLPSRYFTPAFFFWAAVVPAALFLELEARLVSRLAFAAALAVVMVLAVGTLDWQVKVPEAWSLEFRTMDAAASALLVDAQDEEYLSRLTPDRDLRDRGVVQLRQRRWSVFAEERAAWVGANLLDRFTPALPRLCEGRVAMVKPLSQPSTIRITGSLVSSRACSADPVELVVTDKLGNIVGLGRTVFPAISPFGPKSIDFLAYSRTQGGPTSLRMYAILPNRLASFVAAIQTESGRISNN